MMIQVEGSRIVVTTRTLLAQFDNGLLVSLKASETARNLLSGDRPAGLAPLQLVFSNGASVDLGADAQSTVVTRKLNDHMAEVRFHGWSADGVLRISECPETGDLLLEPSAYSNRAGLAACRYNVAGIAPDLRLIAPFFQGINLELADPLINNSHWVWPMSWEAALLILQGKTEGFWIHVQDTQYRPKGVQVGTKSAANTLGLDTEAFGPHDTNLAAGGLVWRINLHGADWQSPADRYRDWFYQAFDLQPRINARKEWTHEIRLAGCWLDTNPDVLDALAEKIEPGKVLLHLAQWRNYGYDENYPDFTPSDAARSYLAKASAMGFHVMPHCNAIDMDPTHSIFPVVRDFTYRNLDKTPAGWAWDNGWLPVPTSNKALVENRSKKVMVKIHPGLSMWRSLLTEAIEKGLTGLPTDTVFVDVTANIWNLHNALVENMTCSEGMARLLDLVASIPPGLTVAGEGLNEVIAPGQAFAQAHLFRSHQTSYPGLERTGGTAVGDFLFGALCRTIGYSDLSGGTENSQMRMRVHHSLAAIPTFTHLRPEQIRQPNKAVQELFDLANA